MGNTLEASKEEHMAIPNWLSEPRDTSTQLLRVLAEVERLKASEIVRDACGSRPDLMSGKDYVDEVRGHLPPSLEDRVREAIENRTSMLYHLPGVSADDFGKLTADIVALVEGK